MLAFEFVRSLGSQGGIRQKEILALTWSDLGSCEAALKETRAYEKQKRRFTSCTTVLDAASAFIACLLCS